MDKFKIEMKNILNSLYVLAALIMFGACEQLDDKLTYKGDPVSHFTEAGYAFIVTPSDTGYDVKLGTTTAAAATINISINSNSTAIEGVQFKQINKTINIDQGAYVGALTIEPILDGLDGDYVLILDIENSSVPEGVSMNQSFVMTLSRFCPLDISQWVGVTFDCDEPGYAIYDVNFTAGAAANTIVSDNFWDFGGAVTYTFSESTSPSEAVVTIEEQTVNMGGSDYIVVGSGGTYEQCSRTMIMPYQVLRPSDGAIFDDNVHTYTLK